MFIKEDFDGLFLNPYDIPETKAVLNSLPQFRDYDVFKNYNGSVPLWKIIKYIVCIYTKGTPFDRIENVLKRKLEAGKFCAFDLDADGKNFKKEYNKIIFCEPDITLTDDNKPAYTPSQVNKMILKYCFLQHDPKHAILVKYRDFLENELNNSETEQDATKRKAILANIEQISSTISKTTSEYLNNDSNNILTSDLFEQIEMEELDLTPEAMAAKIKRGGDVVSVNPYGKDYVVDKLLWIP